MNISGVKPFHIYAYACDNEPWSKGHEDDVGCSSVPNRNLNLLLGPVLIRNCDLLKISIWTIFHLHIAEWTSTLLLDISLLMIITEIQI